MKTHKGKDHTERSQSTEPEPQVEQDRGGADLQARVLLTPSQWPPLRLTLEDCLLLIGEQRSALDRLESSLIDAAREPAPTQEQPLLDAKQTGAFLHIPTCRVYELARQGKIPAVRIGAKCVRFRPAALQEWVVRLEKKEF